MRLLSAALALSLPLTPFIVFMVMTDYSGILIYVFMGGITAIIASSAWLGGVGGAWAGLVCSRILINGPPGLRHGLHTVHNGCCSGYCE